MLLYLVNVWLWYLCARVLALLPGTLHVRPSYSPAPWHGSSLPTEKENLSSLALMSQTLYLAADFIHRFVVVRLGSTKLVSGDFCYSFSVHVLCFVSWIPRSIYRPNRFPVREGNVPSYFDPSLWHPTHQSWPKLDPPGQFLRSINRPSVWRWFPCRVFTRCDTFFVSCYFFVSIRFRLRSPFEALHSRQTKNLCVQSLCRSSQT